MQIQKSIGIVVKIIESADLPLSILKQFLPHKEKHASFLELNSQLAN